ncbi:MAG: tetratricopeptide repeat protein [Candidatus Caenarcaniphilales bacterium]|nr:tetratricopeptide repeat protein [Candidatus Caenarcaniphilales bacterium]
MRTYPKLLLLLLTLTNVSILPSFSKVPKISPALIANLLDSASQSYNIGNYSSAINVYKKALEGDPNNPRIHFELGASYLGQARYLLAIEHFLTALDLNPALIEGYFSLAYAYQAISKNQEALQAYRQGLGLDLKKEVPKSSFNNRVEMISPESNTEQTESGNIPQKDFQKKKLQVNSLIKEARKAQINEIKSDINSNETTLSLVPFQNIEEVANEDTSRIQQVVFPSSQEDYYYKQIVEYNTELEKHPEDYQLKYRLGLLYTKVKLFDPAYKLFKEISLKDSELAQELKSRIEQGETKVVKTQKLQKENKNLSNKKISIKTKEINEKRTQANI